MKKARALLIGIDSYAGVAASYQLGGSVADVEAMGMYLAETLGITPDRIEWRVEEEASRQGILEALERLREEVEPGDLVVIHYSGHGSRLPSFTGRKGSAWEETIVPFDGRPPDGAPRDIRGSELRTRLMPIARKTPRLVLVFDCCHAGTLVRNPFAARVRALPPPAADRISNRTENTSALATVGNFDARFTFIGACRRYEKAHEVCLCEEPPRYAGALTHHLLRQLRSAPEGATWRDVMEQVELELTAEFRGQHPQLEGEADRILFELDQRRPERYFRVVTSDFERQRASLDGGWFQGVHMGSRWAVSPPRGRTERSSAGDASVDWGGDAGPRQLEVTAVRSATCDVKWSTSSRAGPKVGSRVVLAEPGPRQVRRSVRIVQHEPRCSKMEQFQQRLEVEIEENPMLRRVGDATAEVSVHLVPSSLVGDLDFDVDLVDPSDPEGVWVVDHAGELAMPRRHWDDPFALIDIISNLVAGSRWQHLAALRRAAPVGLEGLADWQVHFRIFRPSDGGWLEIGSGGDRSHDFEVGDRFALEIRHAHRRRLYVYVLQLSADAEIRLVYPPPGALQPIERGQRACFGFEEAEAQVFVLDPRFPYGAPGSDVIVEERFEIIATPEPTDFRPLFQGRLRRGDALDRQFLENSLGRHLRLAYSGWREQAPLEEGGSSEWTVETRVVRVRRPQEIAVGPWEHEDSSRFGRRES